MCSVASVVALQLLAFAASLVQADEAESHFMLNAGGSLVRREGNKHQVGITTDEEDRITHNVGKAFAMLDLNGDGLITTAELKKDMKQKHLHLQTLTSLLEHAAGHAGTSFEEFNEIVHRLASQGVLRHIAKHSTLHRHGNASVSVSCGGHTAVSCEACPTTDSTGATVADHRAEWCHGDCVYNPADSKCHKEGTVTVSGSHTLDQAHTTSPVPDLLNPNHTERDDQVIEAATEAAIREEKLEAKEKEEQKEEAKKFNWTTFWLIVAITSGVILCVCCISTGVAAFVIYGTNAGKKLEEEPADEEGGEEDDGETSAASDDANAS